MKKIALDAGHSEAPKNFSLEDEIDNIMCNRIQRLVAQSPDKFVSVVIPVVTAKGVKLDLMGKVYFANDIKADVMVSIHCNWSDTNNKASGYNIFYNNPGDAKDPVLAERSKILAQKVSESLKGSGFLPFNQDIETDNKVGCGNLAVCSYTKMPAILIELCFLSNVIDAKDAVNVDHQEKMARAILQGIDNFLS